MTDKSYIDVVYGSNKKPFTAYPEKFRMINKWLGFPKEFMLLSSTIK